MRLFGLIGYPLSHSFSKNYFTDKFRKEGIQDCRYDNFEITDLNSLPKIIADNPGLEGLNITIPHKESVLRFLNEMDDVVTKIKACNCIKITNEKLIGYNTDVVGFERSLLSKLGQSHKNALILGTGGAAKAVEFVLRKNKIHYKYVSRYPSVKNFSYEQLTPAIIKQYSLIINASPLGMYPKVAEAPPLPYESLNETHLLFDLIYNPEKTLLLKKGEQQGAQIQNGYEMLIFQAEESWRIWNE